MASSTDASEGLLQRVESFVSDNRKVIVAGAALAVAAGGVGYYLYASRNAAKPIHDLEKAPEGKKKKKSKKKKVGDDNGPILEERKPKLKPSDTASGATSGTKPPCDACVLSRLMIYLASCRGGRGAETYES